MKKDKTPDIGRVLKAADYASTPKSKFTINKSQLTMIFASFALVGGLVGAALFIRSRANFDYGTCISNANSLTSLRSKSVMTQLVTPITNLSRVETEGESAGTKSPVVTQPTASGVVENSSGEVRPTGNSQGGGSGSEPDKTPSGSPTDIPVVDTVSAEVEAKRTAARAECDKSLAEDLKNQQLTAHPVVTNNGQTFPAGAKSKAGPTSDVSGCRPAAVGVAAQDPIEEPSPNCWILCPVTVGTTLNGITSTTWEQKGCYVDGVTVKMSQGKVAIDTDPCNPMPAPWVNASCYDYKRNPNAPAAEGCLSNAQWYNFDICRVERVPGGTITSFSCPGYPNLVMTGNPVTTTQLYEYIGFYCNGGKVNPGPAYDATTKEKLSKPVGNGTGGTTATTQNIGCVAGTPTAAQAAAGLKICPGSLPTPTAPTTPTPDNPNDSNARGQERPN